MHSGVFDDVYCFLHCPRPYFLCSLVKKHLSLVLESSCVISHRHTDSYIFSINDLPLLTFHAACEYTFTNSFHFHFDNGLQVFFLFQDEEILMLLDGLVEITGV